MTSSSPEAVERAAARPPAATSPTTHAESPAISGVASTMMSRSMVPSSVAASMPSAHSVVLISPVLAQF